MLLWLQAKPARWAIYNKFEDSVMKISTFMLLFGMLIWADSIMSSLADRKICYIGIFEDYTHTLLSNFDNLNQKSQIICIFSIIYFIYYFKI
jgi:hypothetical protein